MAKKAVIVACSVLLVASLFILYNVIGGRKVSHEKINDGITRIEPFSITSKTTDLLTSVEGTVFYKSNVGKHASAQIIASINIDPHDWGGVAFYFPDEWQISEVKTSYPQGTESEDPTSLVTILTNNDDEVKWRSSIEINRDSISASKYSGGYGTVVIDLIYKNEKPKNPLNFAVSIGSKINNGQKIAGTDTVDINLK